MSAFADDSDHFFDWLRTGRRWMPDAGWSPKSFAPRRLYRDYLVSLIQPHLAIGDDRLRIHRARMVDVVETAGGVEVVADSGDRHQSHAAILATGNEGPTGPSVTWQRDFWSSAGYFDIPPDAKVAIIGTGLSMVDSVVSPLDAGHAGQIIAVSRRGLMPRPHDESSPVAFDRSNLPTEASVADICHLLRQQARQASDKADWRSVVDGLRPYTQSLWEELPEAEKRRFLKHARPWWDVHRHRMAPQVCARIQAAREAGRLNVIAARVAVVGEDEGGPAIRIRRRGSSTPEMVSIDYLIDCRGHSADLASSTNPLLRELIERGTIRADALGLGVDVTETCAVIDARGAASRRIFAVGPITMGRFWEIVVIPDIRLQVEKLATRLARGTRSFGRSDH